MLKASLYIGAMCCSGYYIARDFVSLSKVTGESMQPTLNPQRGKNDWVILDERVSSNYDSVSHGEVVVFKNTRNPSEYNVKRVIALEGDTVETLGYKNKFVKIPPGHCWLEGDNSSNSDDSNRTGPIPLGLITSKARYIIPRMAKVEAKFPHDRVALNPRTDIYKVQRIHELPPLDGNNNYSPNVHSKIKLNVNAATKDDFKP